MEIGRIAGIWRYPVKSLAAEALDCATVSADGLEGDRRAQLVVESGHARVGKAYRGKEHDRLHTLADVAVAIAAAAERGVTARVAADGRYFDDDAPVSIVFDTWIAQAERALGLALDPLRWRPNFYVRAVAGFDDAEEALLGAALTAGDVRLRVRDTIKRCVVPTYDVQGGTAEPAVLRWVARHRGNVMGIYCEVESAGTVRGGDAVRLRAR